MKKILALVALVAAVSAYSQGTVNFNNRVVTAGIQAPISYADGNAAGPMAVGSLVSSLVTGTAGAYTYGGDAAQAALYGGAPGTPENNLVLLTPAVGFKNGSLAGYVNVGTAGTRTIDTIAPGNAAIVQIRAWDPGVTGVASYEAAAALVSATHGVYLGKSGILSISALGGTPPGAPTITPPNLTGLQSFSIVYTVPEPSIIGLGILGAVAGLMVFRRRE